MAKVTLSVHILTVTWFQLRSPQVYALSSKVIRLKKKKYELMVSNSILLVILPAFFFFFFTWLRLFLNIRIRMHSNKMRIKQYRNVTLCFDSTLHYPLKVMSHHAPLSLWGHIWNSFWQKNSRLILADW